MESKKRCPTCGATHKVELTHEFKVDSEKRRQLDLVLESQSVNVDDAKLEWLSPLADDGQEFKVETNRIDDRRVLLTIKRVPRGDGVPAGVPTNGEPPRKSRADMETEAAELGLRTDRKWNDLQLAQAIKKHKGNVAVTA